MVRMSRAVIPRRSISTTASPDLRAYSSRRLSMATGEALPGKDIPSASAALAMVLAVLRAAGALTRTDGAFDDVDVLA